MNKTTYKIILCISLFTLVTGVVHAEKGAFTVEMGNQEPFLKPNRLKDKSIDRTPTCYLKTFKNVSHKGNKIYSEFKFFQYGYKAGKLGDYLTRCKIRMTDKDVDGKLKFCAINHATSNTQPQTLSRTPAEETWCSVYPSRKLQGFDFEFYRFSSSYKQAIRPGTCSFMCLTE